VNVQWIDRTAGVCGVFASQLFPAGDMKIEKLIRAFEEQVYRQSSKRMEKI
jgi:hypothetical protein